MRHTARCASTETANTSWSSPVGTALALGAVVVLAAKTRYESRIAMRGKHDRTTRRGKIHRHTWGRCRMPPSKKKEILNNWYLFKSGKEKESRPMPMKCWDEESMITNKMYENDDEINIKMGMEDIEKDHAVRRKHWKELMGKKGPQWAFLNWTPPELEDAKEPPAKATAEEPPAEAAACLAGVKISAKDVKDLRGRSRAGILDCQKALKESDGDMEKAMEWLKKKGMAKADKKAGNAAVEGNITSYVHFNSKIAVLVEVNSETDFAAGNDIFKDFTADIAMQIAANPDVAYVSADDVPEEMKVKERELEMKKEDLEGKPDNVKDKIVEGRLKKKFEEKALLSQKWLKDEDQSVEQAVKATVAKLGENIIIRRFVRLTLGEGLEKKDADFAAGVEKELSKYKTDGAAPPEPKKEPEPEAPKAPEAAKPEEPKVAVSAAAVKALRERSGAGILDSKKALAACDNDVDKAMEWLKKKGMAKADKKAGNLSVEGAVDSYVHFNSKLGVIVEVNSETDFVAINAIFKEFVKDVAMQIAANPSIQYVSTDDVDPAEYEKEKALEMNKEDLAGKPDNIKEKIVDGRLKKKFEEVALLGQKWLKDEEKTVQDVLKEKIAQLGENLIVRRFERLSLGEGLEKQDADFAAGVEKELEKYRA